MIIDSSSLIIFAKTNRLELLVKLYGNIEITKEIYHECVEEGMKINAPDAKIIKKAFEEGKVIILPLNENYKNLSRNLSTTYNIDSGESDAISLSIQDSRKTLVMDESLGRNVAKLHGLSPKGSLRVILEAYLKDLIDEKEIKVLIGEMIKNKFRVGGDIINEFWGIFEYIKKVKKKKS